MRKIRIAEHISLDGIVQPGGPGEDSEYAHGGWTAPYRTPEGAAALAQAYGSGFDLLLGRRTYDLWSGFWPKVQGGPFAGALNAATKYVATHRPQGLSWGPVQDLGPDALARIRQLKSEDGPDLVVCGSAMLASALLTQGLVDEVVLAVYPLLLGRGKRCFPEGAETTLTLVGSTRTPTGVLLNTYRTAPAAAQGRSPSTKG
jgi:dihydrofolate reductase